MRRRCRSSRTRTWLRHSRRIEPIRRSANGFCQGLWGAVRASAIPALNSVPKLLAVDLVTVAQEMRGSRVIRERLHDLLGGPVGGGVLDHVEVDDASAMVREHEENEEDAQARGGHREEIDR